MSQADWGMNQTKLAAIENKHLADKAEFAITIIEGVVNGFDVIEKEIVDMSNSGVQPTREGIRAFAHRIDGQQNQIKQALQQLKEMVGDMKTTNQQIQSNRSGW